MSGEIGVAGDIATGMLIGRAIEPRAGEIAHGAHTHGLCLNCGTALQGDFCHACGQAGHVHRTLTSIGHDLLHGVFHFEGKVWRTLPMLVLHPGELTRRYIAGERARFVSPLALFLFAVFLMFAVIHSTAGEFEFDQPAPSDRAETLSRLDRRIAKADAALAETHKSQAAAIAQAPDHVDHSGLSTGIAALEATRAGLAETRAALSSGQISTADAQHRIPVRFKSSWPALDKGIAKANANPGLMIYKLQSSAYKYSWALIPISTPFVAMLFLWKRRFKIYDHAIFVTYSLSFMLLLVVLLSLCLAIDAPEWISAALILLVPPAHMFVQLRGAYSLRKRSAAWRTVALLLFAWMALLTFVFLLLVMGLME